LQTRVRRARWIHGTGIVFFNTVGNIHGNVIFMDIIRIYSVIYCNIL
jgi:hypothetical protein